MIRLAQVEDIPSLLLLGEEFFKESGLGEITEYNCNSTEKMFKILIETDIGVLLVMENEGLIIGGAGAIISPLFFNDKEKCAQEFFWFVSDPYRGNRDSLRMFTALEQAVKDKGAAIFGVSSLAVNPIDEFYIRKGYKKQETLYIRRL